MSTTTPIRRRVATFVDTRLSNRPQVAIGFRLGSREHAHTVFLICCCFDIPLLSRNLVAAFDDYLADRPGDAVLLCKPALLKRSLYKEVVPLVITSRDIRQLGVERQVVPVGLGVDLVCRRRHTCTSRPAAHWRPSRLRAIAGFRASP